MLSFWMVLATFVAARGRRREQVGIVSTSDSKLKGCTVWQADRTGEVTKIFPALGLFLKFSK